MDNSWIVDNLTNALNTWNDKLGETTVVQCGA